MISRPRAVQKSSKASATRAHGSRYAMTRCEIHGRNGNFKPRAIIAIARIFLRLARLRASRGAIPGRAGPPHRSGAIDDGLHGHDQTHLHHLRPLSFPRDIVPQRTTTTASTRRKKSHRLRDRTRPKRDRNETHRARAKTWVSRAYLWEGVRARESRFDIFSARLRLIPSRISYFPLSVPRPKGKRTNMVKRESERALRRSTFVKP